LRRVLPDADAVGSERSARWSGVSRIRCAGGRRHGHGCRRPDVAHRRSALSQHRLVGVIDARALRRDFPITLQAGWLRRHTRVVTAVDAIDLTIERGEMVGYIGPNGAGKSTTLKMLTGVLSPSGGSVRVCGLEPVPQRTQLARQTGVLFGHRSQLWWDL